MSQWIDGLHSFILESDIVRKLIYLFIPLSTDQCELRRYLGEIRLVVTGTHACISFRRSGITNTYNSPHGICSPFRFVSNYPVAQLGSVLWALMYSHFVEVDYCCLHVTLPNRVLGFISSGDFKPLFLCEFFTD